MESAADRRSEKAKAAALVKAERKAHAGLSRTLKLRIYPRPEQAKQIKGTIGTIRFVWNTIWLPMLKAVEVARRQAAEASGGTPESWKAAWKANPDPRDTDYNRARIVAMNERGGRAWIKEAVLTPLTRASITFADAVKASRGQTRTGQRRKSKLGHVQPRKRANDSRAGLEWQLQGKGRFGGRQLNLVVDQSARIVNVPGIGAVAFKDKTRLLRRYLDAGVEACKLTLKRDGANFYVCIAVRGLQPADAHLRAGGAVGIAMGVANPLTTSEGKCVTHHQGLDIKSHMARLQRRKMRAKRALSRKLRSAAKKAGALSETGAFKKSVPIPMTNRMRRTTEQVKKIDRQIVGYRADWQRKQALELATTSEIIVVEALTLKNKPKSATSTLEKPGRNGRAKAGRYKSLLERGFGSMRSRLKSKAEEVSGRVIEVDPAYTSQTCPMCGHVDQENRKTQATFACQSCDYKEHADVVGALNILHRGMSTGAPPDAGRGGLATGPEPSGTGTERAVEPSNKPLREPQVSDEGATGSRNAKPQISRNELDAARPTSACPLTTIERSNKGDDG